MDRFLPTHTFAALAIKGVLHTRSRLHFLILLLTLSCLSLSNRSVAQITWTNRTHINLNGVIYGTNAFVAVGDQGFIKRSTDGINWDTQISGTSVKLYGVAFGNQRYAAVGENGTILTSTDGISWTARTSGITKTLYNITYAQNLFVAVGETGTILTSPDGVIWTARNSDVTIELREIIYGNNQFVAAYIAGTIVTSPDGIIWTKQSIPAIPSNGLAYGNGLYVNVSPFGGILSSPDAVNYTVRSGSGLDGSFQAVNYASGQFTAVGNLGQIRTSPDGINWTSRTSNVSTALFGVAFGNNLYVAVGETGAITTSPDGVTWTRRAQGTTKPLLDLAYGNGRFVTVGGQGANLVSTDGINWELSQTAPTTNEMTGIDYGLGAFLLVFNSSTNAYSSTDGFNWLANRNNPQARYKIRFRNNRFFALGTDAILTTSTDGYNWQRLTTPVNFYPFTGIAYGNGIYVTVGFSSVRSTDLTNWTYTYPLETPNDIAFGNGLFVAVGNVRTSLDQNIVTIQTSPDGITWTRQSPNDTGILQSVIYANNTFVAVGTNGLIYTSPNGTSWTRQISNTTQNLTSVRFGGNVYVAVGQNGTILTAPVETAAPVVTGLTVSPATVCAGQPLSFSANVGVLASPYAFTLTNGTLPVSGTTASAAFSQTLLAQQTGPQAYTLTVQSGTLVASQTVSATVNSCSVTSPLTLIQPLYDCATGSFTFQSYGGDGSTVSYLSVGITGWSNQAGPFLVQPYCDVQPFTLYARQESNPTAVVSYTWNYKLTCPVNCSTTTPPSLTNPAGCNSPVSSQGPLLTLLAPEYNCQTGVIRFRPNGGNGSLIEYLSVGITGWTTNCLNQIDSPALIQDIQNPSSTIDPFVLIARQKYPDGTYYFTQYRWDAKASCALSGRESAANTVKVLDVTVLGNPTLSNSVNVIIRELDEPAATITVIDLQGKRISKQTVEQVSAGKPVSIQLGNATGLYLIEVRTGARFKRLKVVRQ